MARGRKKIELDPQEFQDKLTEFETGKTFTTRGMMWSAFCDLPWAQNLSPRPLSVSVAISKSREFNTTILTKCGAKGQSPTGPNLERKVQKMGQRQINAIKADMLAPNLDGTKRQTGYVEKKLKAAAKGSLKAAIHLHCIYCAGDKKEVALCQCFECPLHHLRPFQGIE